MATAFGYLGIVGPTIALLSLALPAAGSADARAIALFAVGGYRLLPFLASTGCLVRSTRVVLPASA